MAGIIENIAIGSNVNTIMVGMLFLRGLSFKNVPSRHALHKQLIGWSVMVIYEMSSCTFRFFFPFLALACGFSKT